MNYPKNKNDRNRKIERNKFADEERMRQRDVRQEKKR